MTPATFAVLALASYRTTILLVDDWVPFQPVREWIWRRWPYGQPEHPEDTTPAGRGEAEVIPWTRTVWRSAGGWLAGLVWSKWRNHIRASDPRQPGRTRIGYWWTCPACSGLWVTAGWVGAWWLWPVGTITAALIPAAAGVQWFLTQKADG